MKRRYRVVIIRVMGLRIVLVLAVIGWLGAGAVALLFGAAAGVMCALPSVCGFTVTAIRHGQISVRRAFIHGWHAGYHEAAHSACIQVGDDCAVYLLSERRWTSNA